MTTKKAIQLVEQLNPIIKKSTNYVRRLSVDEEDKSIMFINMFGALATGGAVVASRAIGSVPFLVEDGVNGDIYEDGNTDDLYRRVKALLDDPARRVQKSKNAYTTITEEWDAEVAAERFVALAGSMLNGGKKDLFESDVCSKAK